MINIDNIVLWAVDPLKQLIEELYQSMVYTEMVSASTQILASEEFEQIVIERKTIDSIFNYDKIYSMIEKAKAEKESNFKLLLRHSLVTQFAYLEAGIKRLITAIFLHQPELFNNELVGKIKIELVEYKRLTEQERADYFFNKYEEHFGKEKYGWKRFERLLEPVGLNGDTDENIRDAITEHGQVRNLILHKNGVADIDFNRQCYHLGYSIGDEISISLEQFNRYIVADVAYCRIILERISQSYIGPLLPGTEV